MISTLHRFAAVVYRSAICNAEASLIMQQSSHGLDRLTQSVLYYPCESCMDALMGNSIFAWLFLDQPNNISGKRNQWCSFLVFVVQCFWFVIDWKEWSSSSDWIATRIINNKTTNHLPDFEPAGWLWTLKCLTCLVSSSAFVSIPW